MFDLFYLYLVRTFYKKTVPDSVKTEVRFTCDAALNRIDQVRDHCANVVAREIHNFREGVVVMHENLPESQRPYINEIETPEGFTVVNNPSASNASDNNSIVSRWGEWFSSSFGDFTTRFISFASSIGEAIYYMMFPLRTGASSSNQETSVDIEDRSSSEDDHLQQEAQSTLDERCISENDDYELVSPDVAVRGISPTWIGEEGSSLF